MRYSFIPKFCVIGISVRTSNENEQSGKDLHLLWERFFSEGILEKIPNKIDSSIYSVYTDYEKDFTKPYTTILGCKVADLSSIPTGMVGKIIESENYESFKVKGNIHEGIVYQTWVNIWNSKLNRKYTTDFELYDERALNPEDAEVEIFVSVN